MAVKHGSLAGLVLRVALAFFLIVSGIMTLQLDSGIIGRLQAEFGGNELASAVHSFLKGDMANIVIILLGILELIAGVFLLAEFFVDTGSISSFVLLIILILWIVVIALVDVLGTGGLLKGAFKNMNTFLAFLKSLTAHLLILGAILHVRE